MVIVQVFALGNLSEELWHKGQEFLTISINFEIALFVFINDVAVSFVLFEEELRDLVFLSDIIDERDVDVVVLPSFAFAIL